MSKVIVPENYKAVLNPYDTQKAIMLIHSIFEKELCSELDLSRVSAPLLVPTASGLNDNLNGVERPVGFDIKETGEDCQVVQSLAKWKRKALKDYDFHVGKGLYTDMNAIRRDEEMDNLHSVYVDQWDWEKVIRESDRTLSYLKKVVQKIVNAIVDTEDIIREVYPELNVYAPKKRQIKYLTTQELEDMYPDKTAKEREDAVTEQYKTVCLMKIGGALKSGKPHDGRAPDYDDWALNCVPRKSGQTAHHRGLRRPQRTALPQGAAGGRAALHHRRRHRSEPSVHAAAGKSPHRRSPVLCLGRRYEKDLQGSRHYDPVRLLLSES